MSKLEDYYNKAFFTFISWGPALQMVIEPPADLNLYTAFKAAASVAVGIGGTTLAYRPDIINKIKPKGP